MTLSVVVVVGNPNTQSRTLTVAYKLAVALFPGPDCEIELIDLADHTVDIFAWPSEQMSRLTERVANNDVAIFASPTYKAGYTGLLKAFLDRYATNGLTGLVAIPVMTGGDKTHSMAPDVNLAPLLVELGAVVPGRGFYFIIDQLSDVDEVVAAAANVYAANLRSSARVAAAVGDR